MRRDFLGAFGVHRAALQEVRVADQLWRAAATRHYELLAQEAQTAQEPHRRALPDTALHRLHAVAPALPRREFLFAKPCALSLAEHEDMESVCGYCVGGGAAGAGNCE